MQGLSTTQRIEKALERLRQRYGVSGGLTSEPKVKEIRNGTKVAFNIDSLKQFNEDLNTLEVLAYAHNQVDKLSGQLLLDTAKRLPNIMKRRYLDFVDRCRLDLNKPDFESLRRFVVHEIKLMGSDSAQAFFTLDEKTKPRTGFNDRETYMVRKSNVSDQSSETGTASPQSSYAGRASSSRTPNVESNWTGRRSLEFQRSEKRPAPECFVCANGDEHFLGECKKFATMTNQQKRTTVYNSGRCVNCLSYGHVARVCTRLSKCKKCPLDSRNKHATALHDCYTRPETVNKVKEKEKEPTASETPGVVNQVTN